MNTTTESLLDIPIAQIIETECLHWFADGSDGKRLLMEFCKVQRFRSSTGGITSREFLETPEIIRHEFGWETRDRIGYIVQYVQTERKRVARETRGGMIIVGPNPGLD